MKYVKIAVVVILFAMVCVGVVWLYTNRTKVANGKYEIQNNSTYPDAYIIVEDGEAQFFNIDLNAMYKDDIVEDAIAYEKYKKKKLSSYDEQNIEDSIDLNRQFCDNKVALDYSLENCNSYDDDSGIGHYNFGWITDMSYLYYEYDWKNGSIKLSQGDTQPVVFIR